MRGINTAYEIRIYVPKEENVAEKEAFSKFAHRTFGIRANSLEQAESKAEKIAKKHNGHVSSVRKAEIETIYATTCMEYLIEAPKVHPALAIDDFIWKKRNIRRGNLEKEKVKIDLDNKEIV